MFLLRRAPTTAGPTRTTTHPEGAHGRARVRRRQRQARGGRQVPRPRDRLPRPLGPAADGVLLAATQFPAKYRGGAFVAFHGSWNRAPRPQGGYNVTYVPFDDKGMPRGGYEVFASGFPGVAEFTKPAGREVPAGRPRLRARRLDVRQRHGEGPRVAHLLYGREAPRRRRPAPRRRPAAAPLRRSRRSRGAGPRPGRADGPAPSSTRMACATCHMPDGSGVPGLQPALVGSKVVAGRPATVIKVLLLGPEKALPAHKASERQPDARRSIRSPTTRSPPS